MTPQEAFWTIHFGLEREGPGDPASLQARITEFRADAGVVLRGALDEPEAEITHWHRAKAVTGYLQILAGAS